MCLSSPSLPPLSSVSLCTHSLLQQKVSWWLPAAGANISHAARTSQEESFVSPHRSKKKKLQVGPRACLWTNRSGQGDGIVWVTRTWGQGELSSTSTTWKGTTGKLCIINSQAGWGRGDRWGMVVLLWKKQPGCVHQARGREIKRVQPRPWKSTSELMERITVAPQKP